MSGINGKQKIIKLLEIDKSKIPEWFIIKDDKVILKSDKISQD